MSVKSKLNWINAVCRQNKLTFSVLFCIIFFICNNVDIVGTWSSVDSIEEVFVRRAVISAPWTLLVYGVAGVLRRTLRFDSISDSPKRFRCATKAGIGVAFDIFFTSLSGVVNWFISSNIRLAVFDRANDGGPPTTDVWSEETDAAASDRVDVADRLEDGRICVGTRRCRWDELARLE